MYSLLLLFIFWLHSSPFFFVLIAYLLLFCLCFLRIEASSASMEGSLLFGVVFSAIWLVGPRIISPCFYYHTSLGWCISSPPRDGCCLWHPSLLSRYFAGPSYPYGYGMDPIHRHPTQKIIHIIIWIIHLTHPQVEEAQSMDSEICPKPNRHQSNKGDYPFKRRRMAPSLLF